LNYPSIEIAATALKMWGAAHNTANNDAPSLEMDYRCRSIAFGARELIVHSAKSNGVVCRDVSCYRWLNGTIKHIGEEHG